MGFFRKRKSVQVDPRAINPQSGLINLDHDMLQGLVDSGCDLSQPREVTHYCYASSRSAAEDVAKAAVDRGFQAIIEDPPEDDPDVYPIVVRATTSLTDDVVRASREFFERICQRPAAMYDGWEAAVAHV